MKNGLFDRFKPKESKFFPLLREMADVITEAASLIGDCVQASSHEEVVSIYKKIKEQEHKGDKIQNTIFTELNDTFITPFDREDIVSLAGTMDSVIDMINSSAKRIMLYSPKSLPESARVLALLLQDAASDIKSAINDLPNLKGKADSIRGACGHLNEIESKADDVYEHFLIDLFENEKDAIEVIKLKDILHEMERASDSAETVGKILKTIIIKYT
ncbi:DUF47 domain-containing protein [Dysgonomonas sp. 25]|uniref:DUF47 domain-containing protein n=1 Tax=Dysgonomonas sp. 25 TaxID=2302933 RepID=UPI0013D72331|nr:DUF47 family protein [Dysgonomonas sp. 25]NDV68876.1 DUF47 domain-containing protein [Dysgonomonas sp. 25]